MILELNQLKAGRVYGLSFSYSCEGEVYHYLMRGVFIRAESGIMLFHTKGQEGKDILINVADEWVTRLEDERTRPTFMRRIT